MLASEYNTRCGSEGKQISLRSSLNEQCCLSIPESKGSSVDLSSLARLPFFRRFQLIASLTPRVGSRLCVFVRSLLSSRDLSFVSRKMPDQDTCLPARNARLECESSCVCPGEILVREFDRFNGFGCLRTKRVTTWNAQSETALLSLSTYLIFSLLVAVSGLGFGSVPVGGTGGG